MSTNVGGATADIKLTEADSEEGFYDISIEQDGSLLKKILVEGDADRGSPADSDDALIHYEARLHADGSKFDASRDRGMRQLQFQVGAGAHDGSTKFQVTRAWDVGVCTMRQKEKCILRAKPKYGYGKVGVPGKIPGGATLEFTMELFSWQAHDWEPAEMKSNKQRSAYALKHKEEGNEKIKAKEWEAAIQKYSVGINFVEFNGGVSTSGGGGAIGDGANLSAEDKALYIAVLSNSALALLKLEIPHGAIDVCNTALGVEPSNIKVLYRRGQARIDVGEWALAIEDADRLLALDPANAEAQKLRQVATVKLQASKKKQKATYGKMFGGLPSVDPVG